MDTQARTARGKRERAAISATQFTSAWTQQPVPAPHPGYAPQTGYSPQHPQHQHHLHNAQQMMSGPGAAGGYAQHAGLGGNHHLYAPPGLFPHPIQAPEQQHVRIVSTVDMQIGHRIPQQPIGLQQQQHSDAPAQAARRPDEASPSRSAYAHIPQQQLTHSHLMDDYDDVLNDLLMMDDNDGPIDVDFSSAASASATKAPVSATSSSPSPPSSTESTSKSTKTKHAEVRSSSSSSTSASGSQQHGQQSTSAATSETATDSAKIKPRIKRPAQEMSPSRTASSPSSAAAPSVLAPVSSSSASSSLSNSPSPTLPTLPVSPGSASLSFDRVFELLSDAHQGQLAAGIPVRPQASPIRTDVPCFFVQTTPNVLTEAERQELLGAPELLVGVKYQSFSNGEIWWSSKSQFTEGVVARRMSRRVRSYKANSNQSESHGYSGRWFNLLSRPDAETEVKKSNCRLFVVPDSPSLVHFWPSDESAPAAPDSKRARTSLPTLPEKQSSSSSSSSPSGTASPGPSPSAQAVQRATSSGSGTRGLPGSPGTDSMQSGEVSQGKGQPGLLSYVYSKDSGAAEDIVHVNGALQVHGDATFQGDLWVRNLRVLGTLTVEGGINGQLVTPPEAADYAEWFEKLDASEIIESGDVVQLRSPEQKITKDTSGLGPFLVVSTAPSVAAGVPAGAKRRDGMLCGFLGQVPIKVHGPIRCGDLLVPSGDGDGYAVQGRVFHASDYQPLATAMVSCGLGQHVVLSFVRWPHDTKWNEYRDEDKQQLASIERVWDRTFVMSVLYLFKILALSSGLYQPHFNMAIYMFLFGVEVLLTLWALVHFPNYYEFAWEGYVFETLLTIKLLGCILLLYLLFGASDAVEQNQALTKGEIRDILVDTAFLCYEIFAGWIVVNVMGQTRRAVKERWSAVDPDVCYESDFERRKRVALTKIRNLFATKPESVADDASTHHNPRCGEKATRRMRGAQRAAKFVDASLGLDSGHRPVDRNFGNDSRKLD